uniref:Serpentine receptor class gamma n=1 Tax=Panagrolaimus davidi TaxID=227884 RepID=A0A914QQ22_9BILA
MARINPGISSYLIFINYTATAFVAFNRFTAIGMPSKHSKIWKGRNLKIMIFLMIFIPTIWWSSVQWMNATAHYILTNGQLTYLYDFPEVQMAFRIRAASICLISTIITFIFNVYTFILYRKAFKTELIGRQRKCHFMEIKLLVVSTCTLIFQIFMCIYYALNLIGSSSIPRNTSLISFAAIQWTWISNLLTVGNSVTLFLCSNIVRKYYLKFYGLKCFVKHVVSDVTISIKVTSPSITNYNALKEEKNMEKYAKEVSPNPIV